MSYAAAIPPPRLTLSASRLSPRRNSHPESSGTRDRPESQKAAMPMRARQPAGWLSVALQRLDCLANLEPGWDEASAQPVSLSLIAAVANFLASDLVSGLGVQPDIVPTFEGGLLIEWHTESVDLIIESPRTGSPSFYFFNNETEEEIEAPLGQRLDAIETAFAKLASR